jgi:translocation and assembly module TamB
MSRRKDIAIGIIGVTGGLILLAALLLFIVAGTHWGREQARQIALEQLNEAIQGEAHIGRVGGNLLWRVRLYDVRIVDEEERPFIAADYISTRYSLLSLLLQRIILINSHIENATIILDEPPGEEWNYLRIFAPDDDPTPTNWGDWVEFRGMTMDNVYLRVQSEWTPSEDKTPAEQQEEIREVTSPDSRANIVAVPAGFQNVMVFSDLNAAFYRIVVARPDVEGIPIEVERFNGIAQPFRPPAAEIVDLRGTFNLVGDSLFMRDVRARLPESVISGGGLYALGDGDLYLDLHGAPAAFDDLRWLYPRLPTEGGGELKLLLAMKTDSTRVEGSDLDLVIGDGVLQGRFDIMFGDTMRVQDTNLRFRDLDTRIIEGVIPDFRLPRHGLLTGHAILEGDPDALMLDADVTYDDFVLGVNRLVVEGQVAFEDELEFTDLYVRAAPVHLAVVRQFVDLPVRGILTGEAYLNGRPSGRLDVNADLSLEDPQAGLSRVRAVGGFDTRDELRLHDLYVRIDPLRLDVLRGEIPELPRGGVVVGEVRADGYPGRRLDIDGQIRLTDPATGITEISARGGLIYGDEVILRNLAVRASPLQLDLLRPYVEDLPPGAVATGQLRLDGPVQRRVDVDGRVRVTDPATGVSEVSATGGVSYADELVFRDLFLRFDPLQLDLVRAQLPDLPAGATLTGPIRLSGAPSRLLEMDGNLALRDPATGLSRVRVAGGVRVEEEILFRDLALTFDPLQLDLLLPFAEQLPPGAVVQGPLRLDGSPAGILGVRGDLVIDDPTTGISRVEARGGIGFAEEIRFRSLNLRFLPLQVSLVTRFAPDVPMGGTLEGRALLDGSPERVVAFDADLVHTEQGRLSHVTGSGRVGTEPGQPFDVDLILQPLALGTVGQFVPEAGLHGEVSGSLIARGTASNVVLRSDLLLPDDGALRLDGTFDLASDLPSYNLDAWLSSVNIAAVSRRAPAQTDLTGRMAAQGQGTDPETMNAVLEADLMGPRVGDLEADEVRLRLAVDEGLLRSDESLIRLATAEGRLDGSFGLIEGRYGEMDFRVAIDSLGAFDPWITDVDTAIVEPRPAARTVVVERTLARMQEAEMAAEVEYQATGRRPEVVLPPDTTLVDGVRRDFLAGRVEAEGTLRGNVHLFDADARVEAEEVFFQGNYMEYGDIDVQARHIGAEISSVDLDGEFGMLLVGGFAYDSARVSVRYDGLELGSGTAMIILSQDEYTDVQAGFEFTLALDQNEIRMTETELRFDEVVWQSAAPGTVSWGGEGVEVESIELVSNLGGRIFLDGRLPFEGPTDMVLEADLVDVQHIMTLLQQDTDLEASVAVSARVTGSAASPDIEGEIGITDFIYEGREMPDAVATVSYAGQRLEAEGRFVQDGQEVAVFEGDLPFAINFATPAEIGLVDGSVNASLNMNGLPLDILSVLSEEIDAYGGLAAGELTVTGTTADPVIGGYFMAVGADIDVYPIGIRFERFAASLRAEGTTVFVDSLTAWTGGPIRVEGQIDIADLTTPVFDLTAVSRDAWVVRTDDARLRVDADITIEGPLDGVVVSGTARARQGVIYIPELVQLDADEVLDLDDESLFRRVSPELRALRQALLARPDVIENLTVDIDVVIDGDVWLRSSEANVEVYTPPEVGPVTVGFDFANGGLTLTGTINAERGEYEFLNRRLEVSRGSATFDGSPQFNPFVQLVAEHEVQLPSREALRIRVVLSGLAQDLTLALESDAEPPIPQSELLSYFVFGREASSLLHQQTTSLRSAGPGAMGSVSDVAGLAAQQFLSVVVDLVVGGFEAQTARELGLDVFRVTTTEVPAEVLTGRFIDAIRSTEFELGSYISPRWFLGGTVRPSLVHPGVRLEYRGRAGWQWITTFRPRFMPAQPTLTEPDPEQVSVFGTFLRREWRF